RTERQHERPGGGQDGTVARCLPEGALVLDAPVHAGDHVQWDLMEVLGEIGGRGKDPRAVGGAPGQEELRARLRVELADARALGGIGHHDEVITPQVAAVRRLDGDVDAVPHDLRVDGTSQVEPLPDGAGRGQHVVDAREVHDQSGSVTYG